MKIEISELADVLFGAGLLPSALDLDTGELYDVDSDAGELVGKKHTIKYNTNEKFPRIRMLPVILNVPIYQSYLVMAQEQLGVRFGSWFDEAPVFEFKAFYGPTSIDSLREEREFMKVAHHKVFDFPDDITLPYFIDYLTEHKIQFAKEWCEKEGYEWYEE